MKITNVQLTRLEAEKGIICVQSSFTDTVYAIDRRNSAMWLIDRRTGAQIEIDGANAHAFADEQKSVADLYLPQRKSWRAG